MLSQEVNYVFPHKLINVFVDSISRHDFNNFEHEVANHLHAVDIFLSVSKC